MTAALPAVFTPAQLAKQLGWSERRVRETARGLGACRVLGNRMILTEGDVAVIKAVADGELDDPGPAPKRSNRGKSVYFFEHYGFVKIGWSGDWKKRLAYIQTVLPHRVTVLAVYRGGVDLERHLHEQFKEYRVRDPGEWFRDCEAIRDYIAIRKGACQLR